MIFPLRDHNPRRRFPVVTLLIVLANVMAFGFQLTLDPAARHLSVLAAGAIPAEIMGLVDLHPPALVPPPFTIWTSMFLHGGLLHLAGNMWFLWLFGDNVEDTIGRARYALFYGLTGTVGALAQCFVMPGSTVPMIGASGAVAGVLGGYLLLFPRARIESVVVMFIFIDRVAVPSWIFLGLWFVGQFFIGAGSGVAWMAHVGGFLGGLGLVRLLGPPRRQPPVQVEYLPPPLRRW